MVATGVVADSGLDGDAAAFGQLRNRLVGIAYRILGSWNQAEDVVQDAWLRWQRYDRTCVLNMTAFLVTTTSRLAINAANSARARRESSLGQRMPEPVARGDDPALGAEQIDVLEHGILLLIERLAPPERAAYVLHEAFDYPYPHIAQVLRTTDVNARQLVSRARKHITTSKGRPANRDGQRRLLHAFVAAARHGEIDDLEKVLTDEVASHSGRSASRRWRVPGELAALGA
jgi:RNA polymerase sigma-70 factor (ECF subfamily)